MVVNREVIDAETLRRITSIKTGTATASLMMNSAARRRQDNGGRLVSSGTLMRVNGMVRQSCGRVWSSRFEWHTVISQLDSGLYACLLRKGPDKHVRDFNEEMRR
ncbi:hypothetical protein [Cryobacterium sp. M15]|uniref:hypothetical protein n=1 Tax=Cryobacterium sp. M15 TaxID=2048291 RepID=UPI0011B0C1FF|nr:hypothetical protein [Cryobacterium sp. M15]